MNDDICVVCSSCNNFRQCLSDGHVLYCPYSHCISIDDFTCSVFPYCVDNIAIQKDLGYRPEQDK